MPRTCNLISLVLGRAGYRHQLDVNSCCAGCCWFSPGPGKQGGGFHLSRGTWCHLFNAAMPSAPTLCPPLAWTHRTDPGWGHVLWAQLRVAVLRSACPLGFVVGLKQRLGWHFRAGLTHGSSLAGGWQQGWGTAATFPGTNRAMPGAPVGDSLWSQGVRAAREGLGHGASGQCLLPATQGSVVGGLWAQSPPAKEKDVLS